MRWLKSLFNFYVYGEMIKFICFFGNRSVVDFELYIVHEIHTEVSIFKFEDVVLIIYIGWFVLWCLTRLLTIFQLYRKMLPEI
jgi:hypothetical protein